jgi:hypothetical protein
MHTAPQQPYERARSCGAQYTAVELSIKKLPRELLCIRFRFDERTSLLIGFIGCSTSLAASKIAEFRSSKRNTIHSLLHTDK